MAQVHEMAPIACRFGDGFTPLTGASLAMGAGAKSERSMWRHSARARATGYQPPAGAIYKADLISPLALFFLSFTTSPIITLPSSLPVLSPTPILLPHTMGFLYDGWARLCALGSPHSAATTTFWPPASKYDPATDVPDQAGKVVLITGGATGIGFQAARQLLRKKAKVYVAGRSAAKVEAAIEALEEETGRRALPLLVDLGDLPSVVRAAEEFLKKEERLDVLYCNA